jgi:hypothetical protein
MAASRMDETVTSEDPVSSIGHTATGDSFRDEFPQLFHNDLLPSPLVPDAGASTGSSQGLG